jgi:hypothetical protein
VSTTTNTLFDISSPDQALQRQIFDELCLLDMLQANPILVEYRRYQQNPFLEYGQGHYAISRTVDDVEKSTNPIHIGNGIFSDFFILMDNMSHESECSRSKDAYCYLKKNMLVPTRSVRVVHIHVRGDRRSENMFRNMSLSLLHNTVDGKNPNEQWFTFETPDINAIFKQIIECMR